MENTPDIAERSASPPSGDSMESSYVLVEKFTCMHLPSNPQPSSAVHRGGSTMLPSCPFHDAACSANQIEQKHESAVASERHQAQSAEVMQADCLTTLHQHSYPMDNEADTVPVLQTGQWEAHAPGGQVYHGFSHMQTDNSIGRDGRTLFATAKSRNNQTKDASSWYLRGVGDWAGS
jgi:hypothetical protein